MTIGVVVLLLAVFGGRLINERGMSVLTPEQKARFIDAFSTQRKYSLLPLIAVVLLSAAFPGRLPIWALLSALVAYVVAISVLGVRKMRSIELPGSYIRSYTTSQAFQIGGLLVYFALLQGWAL